MHIMSVPMPNNIMPPQMAPQSFPGYQPQGQRMPGTPPQRMPVPAPYHPEPSRATPGRRQNVKNRGPPNQQPPGSNMGPGPMGHHPGQRAPHKAKPKKKASDLVISQQLRELVPESQAYMDLLSFERKLDTTIMRKRLDIQEVLKKPMKTKRKLRIFITNTSYTNQNKSPGDQPNSEECQTQWELKIEGRLLDESGQAKPDPRTPKRKFSSFFKSLIIELDKEMYGPDTNFVEWHRNPSTQETDGFQVCNVYSILNYCSWIYFICILLYIACNY